MKNKAVNKIKGDNRGGKNPAKLLGMKVEPKKKKAILTAHRFPKIWQTSFTLFFHMAEALI
jgi:hypothetical protein